MITPEQYLGVVAERIQRSRDQLNSVRIGPPMADVGLFTRSVLLSTMNSCVIADHLQPPQPGYSPQGPPVGPRQPFGY